MEEEIYIMEYKISKSIKNLRILGENFVKNNKNRGNIIINNKKKSIISIISIDYLKKNKIKMIINKDVCNMSFMFKDCELLKSFSYKAKIIQDIKNEIDNINNSEIIDNEDINSFNIINNTIRESTFDNDTCNYFSNTTIITQKKETDESSLYTPVSLERNVKNYINMSYMFFNCNSLTNIPKLLVWKTKNTENMVNMSYTFSNCNSLLSLPDISKWDT